MQENRITMLSSSETYHLRSSSNNPTMDQHNLLPNALESESYPHYLLNAGDTEMPSGNMIGQQNANLNVWNSGGSSSMGCLVNEGSCFESKREHFGPSLAVRGSLSIEGTRHEGTSSLPSQNLNIDLNLNQVDQSDAENVNMIQNNLQSGLNTFPLNRGLFPSEHVSPPEISSDAMGSSSQTANFFEHASSQEVGVLNGRHSSCKRKSIDANPVQSSASGSSSSIHQNKNRLLPPSSSTRESVTSLTMPTSSNYAVSYPPVEQLNQTTDITPSPILSDHYLFYSDPHGTESFLRNTRMRVNPNEYDLPLPTLLPESSFGHSAYQPTQQQQSSFIPVQPRVFSSSASSHSRPHVPAVNHFSQSLHRAPPNGNLGSRIGISSSSTDITGQRSASQDPNRSLMRSNFPEPLVFGSSINASHMVHDSTNLHLASGSRSTPQSSSSTFRGAVNVGTQQMLGSTMVPQQSSNARGSSDVTRRSLFSSGVSHSRNPGIALQHRGQSSMSHEIRSHQPGASSRAHQQAYLRAAPSIERHDSSYLDLQSFMQSIAASREGSRTVSELRNVVDQIRQGRNARLEDLLLIDRSLILRRANLIDRHREMRLDVDNMSYEELLALGERIGYVSTGLSEDKIMSALKQWKYVCITVEPPTGVEPCCICQEDYVKGEELGRLDCGHDFHTACIKQWLMIKNLCPICKKTALGT